MSTTKLLFLSLFSAASANALNWNSSTPATAALTQPYYPPTADCIEFKVPVTVTSENLVFNFPRWKDNLALQDFLTLATTRAGANIPSPIVGKKNETESFTIAASFCTPKTPGKRTIILATHGIGKSNDALEGRAYAWRFFAVAKYAQEMAENRHETAPIMSRELS
jgi:hypothetical protein